ncbi:MAG: hypothetical protein LBU85_11405 [Treponema sp.]|jgi:hypothetical protein|nr:hypothetical protein [Treponema sp.]
MAIKKIFILFLLGCVLAPVFGQVWEEAVLLDVVDIDIVEMRRQRMSGAEAVLKIMEQFIDFTYRFVYISDNRYQPDNLRDFLKVGKNRMIVGVVGFPGQNHVIMAQVLFDRSYFLIIASRQTADVPIGGAMPMVRMNYEKHNSMRRNNVKDFIQRNNILKMGAGSGE